MAGNIEIPTCRWGKEAEWDDKEAGWYVHNSVIASDIAPVWRKGGGGVLDEHLDDDLETALTKAVRYLENNIANAKKHLIEMETALLNLKDGK
jgi:hypothetical protein